MNDDANSVAMHPNAAVVDRSGFDAMGQGCHSETRII
jgi:hypothetical protein